MKEIIKTFIPMCTSKQSEKGIKFYMKKNHTRLVFILLILAIVLIILIAIMNYIENQKYVEHGVMGVDFSETINSLSISNFKVLEEFEDNSDKSAIELGKKIRDFFTISVPELKKEISEKNDYISHYEDINSRLILKYFVMDQDNFEKLCKKINSMKSDLSKEYTKCDFAWNDNMNGIIITCFYQNGEKIVLEMLEDNTTHVMEE